MENGQIFTQLFPVYIAHWTSFLSEALTSNRGSPQGLSGPWRCFRISLVGECLVITKVADAGILGCSSMFGTSHTEEN